MTHEEAANKAKAIIERYYGDQEAMYCMLDDLLIEVLKQHGYTELCRAFEEADKWYA